jgi:hypothetical protein
MAESIESVFMVEASPELREKQKMLLCGSDAVSKECEAGFRSTGKHLEKPIVWAESLKSIPIGKPGHYSCCPENSL